jgi:hypothetical protein
MRETFGMPPEVEVVAELDSLDENKIAVFSQDEPEIVWRRPTSAPRERVWPVLVDAPAKATLRLPLATLGLGAGAVVLAAAAIARRRRSKQWPGLAIVAAAMGVAAAALTGVAQPTASLPWSAGPRPPADAEARELFERLQKNVYRAFEYKQESDVYDVLAQSVDGPLLDSVYNEIYQSLIIRDQGGAVARVKGVEVLKTDVLSTGLLPDRSGVAIQLASTWQVEGSVFHWGHTHHRTNQYSALYTVAQRGERWKITGVELLSQERIVKAGDDPLPPQANPPEPS